VLRDIFKDQRLQISTNGSRVWPVSFIYHHLVNSQLRLLHFSLFDWLKNSDYEPIVGGLRHMENSAPSLKIFREKY